MIFDGKRAQDITIDELRRLVTDCVPEDRHLDYKKTPYPPKSDGADELAKDITAFLNADGGYIVIGVGEDGSGRAADFVSVDDPKAVKRSILDRCLHYIDRRPRLDIGLHEIDGCNIVVIHVPESDQKPHCSQPDAEHHYFWRRYEDGNKIMSTAEIRECFEGDRVLKELAEIRREIVYTRQVETVEREMALAVDDDGLIQFSSPKAFLSHIHHRFIQEIGERRYYRLSACPAPNFLSVNEHIMELSNLVANPPTLRPHGWDLKPLGDVRITTLGVVGGDPEFRQLRMFRNGYMEFRKSADDKSFHLGQRGDPLPVNPHAIIEPATCFMLFAREVCRIVKYSGDLRIGLSLYNAQGMCLLPYAPDTMGYIRSQMSAGGDCGPQPFPDEHIMVDITVRADNLPGSCAWQLVSEVYYRFGYTDDQIPFFDDQHRCTLGNGSSADEDGSI